VDARKRARLLRGAAAWLHEHRSGARNVRFDVIVCECDAREHWSIRHLEAAFDAGD
jgi:Holliday junction resolvase-like predicted endonuclease